MTLHESPLERFKSALPRDSLKQAEASLKQAQAFAAPAIRYGRANPFLLLGAGVLAIVGIVAFTNRRKIAAKAGPMIEDAKVKGHALLEEASTKGHELLEEAKTRGEAVVEKVKAARRSPPRLGATDIH